MLLFENTTALQELDIWIKIIAGITVIILFFKGLARYNKEQIWKRKEFVAKEIKEFFEKKTVQNVLHMLDWEIRKIELFPEAEKPEDRLVTVDRALLNSALRIHGKDTKFSKEEVAIRDAFDYFLDQLIRFEHFIENDLVTRDDFKPYFKYWSDLINKQLDEETRHALIGFIRTYEYTEVIRFLNISPKAHITHP